MKRTVFFMGLLMISSQVFWGGCHNKEEKTFTVGFCIFSSNHIPVMNGFKSGMTDFGYIEGKNIRYIYNGIPENNQAALDKELSTLISQQVDMLFTATNSVALRAKKAVEGQNIPIIFTASNGSVEVGIVKSINHPGNGITGIEMRNTLPDLIELLLQIRPGVKRIYLPYNPEDNITVISSSRLDAIASRFGITFDKKAVHSVEETITAIENLPEDYDAILRIASITLDTRNSELSQAAIRRGIPMVANLPLDDSVLMTLATDPFEMGRQAARLADQMLTGIKEDLPVEFSEPYLTVNLETAEKIGVMVPDGILLSAKKIVR